MCCRPSSSTGFSTTTVCIGLLACAARGDTGGAVAEVTTEILLQTLHLRNNFFNFRFVEDVIDLLIEPTCSCNKMGCDALRPYMRSCEMIQHTQNGLGSASCNAHSNKKNGPADLLDGLRAMRVHERHLSRAQKQL